MEEAGFGLQRRCGRVCRKALASTVVSNPGRPARTDQTIPGPELRQNSVLCCTN